LRFDLKINTEVMIMSAQRSTQVATRQGGQEREQRSLVPRSALPNLPSLLLDPLGFFEDDSFSLIRRMQREMNRVFSQAGLDLNGQGNGLQSTAWIPAIEISYRDGNLVVSAELPGLSEKDVKVEVNDDFLIIRGERRVERQEGDGDVRRTERRYGEFYRAIALPEGADSEHTCAEFQNGVLHVTVPVPQSQKNVREIPVQATNSSSQSTEHNSAGGQKQENAETAEQKKAA
jgi:HSP20 family protein